MVSNKARGQCLCVKLGSLVCGFLLPCCKSAVISYISFRGNARGSTNSAFKSYSCQITPANFPATQSNRWLQSLSAYERGLLQTTNHSSVNQGRWLTFILSHLASLCSNFESGRGHLSGYQLVEGALNSTARSLRYKYLALPMINWASCQRCGHHLVHGVRDHPGPSFSSDLLLSPFRLDSRSWNLLRICSEGDKLQRSSITWD